MFHMVATENLPVAAHRKPITEFQEFYNAVLVYRKYCGFLFYI